MMRQLSSLNRIFQGFSGYGPSRGPGRTATILLSTYMGVGIFGVHVANASLQIAWEAPTKEEGKASEVKVLKDLSLSDLEARKHTTLSEVDPLSKHETAKFEGISLSSLVDDSTKNLTAADRSTTDLVVLKTRAGREVLMPKAFLVKYPQIQLALKRNGQPLGEEAPRVVLPATTNSKIRQENILLDPLFVSELTSVTLTSYERRYGNFLLKRRTDPFAMRGEKIFLQNCVSCHATTGTSFEKVDKVAAGEHPEVQGGAVSNHEFKAVFDKKALRSLVSYLEAFRGQATAKN